MIHTLSLWQLMLVICKLLWTWLWTGYGPVVFWVNFIIFLGSRYVTPSDSHGWESSGKDWYKDIISLTILMNSTSSSKIGLFLLTSIYGTFLGAVCNSSILMSLHCCSCMFALSVCTFFIHSAFSLKSFSSLHIVSQHFSKSFIALNHLKYQ